MPVSKPTDVPRWATGSASYVVAPPETGTAGVITKDTGAIPNQTMPAFYFNWPLNLTYLWILWIQDINNQEFDSSGVGAWTAPHEFQAGINVTCSLTDTAGITSTGNGTGPGLVGVGGTASNGVLGSAANAQPAVYGLNIGTGCGGKFQGGGSSAGLLAIGGVTGAEGIQANGSSSFAGITATGGSGGGNGVQGSGGGSSGIGGYFNGSGSGAGVYGIGGSSGIGVRGDGAGAGEGGYFKGGASAAGVTAHGGGTFAGLSALGGISGGPGVDSTGTGNSAGVIGTGGGTGIGVSGIGGVSGGIGVSATGTGGQPALQIGTGNAIFTGSQPTSSAVLTANTFTATHAAKAWGSVLSAALEGGVNVASVSVTTNTIQVNFATAMADANYDVNLTPHFDMSTGTTKIQWCKVQSRTTTSFQVVLYQIDLTSGAYVTSGVTWVASGLRFTFAVHGRQ